MTDADVQFFWAGVILIAFLAPLVIAAIFVEHIAPASRRWIKRVERNKRGRIAQHAAWIRNGSFYK